jgi:malonate transporter and related proteins
MTILASVILPVFLVIGFGYVAVWRGLLSDSGADGLMAFTQGFAIPCVLFKAISTLDLAQNFDLHMLGSFYAGAVVGFVVGLFGARLIFGRSWEDCVAIGFVGLFSNSVLLGLPITERAYGTAALQGNFAIIALHAPFCYSLGITVMEIVKARGNPPATLPAKVLRAIFSNALIIGISLGLFVNLTGLPLPVIVNDAVDLMARAALPAALFGLGAVLYRYRPEGDMRVILFIVAISLIVHPATVWFLGHGGFGLGGGADLPDAAMRSAVLTAAMAPGVNAYLFAHNYGHARRVAASAVLIGTGACMVTAALWLAVLP